MRETRGKGRYTVAAQKARELDFYAQAGIPNAEVLRMATLTAARVLGAEADRGGMAAEARQTLENILTVLRAQGLGCNGLALGARVEIECIAAAAQGG